MTQDQQEQQEEAREGLPLDHSQGWSIEFLVGPQPGAVKSISREQLLPLPSRPVALEVMTTRQLNLSFFGSKEMPPFTRQLQSSMRRRRDSPTRFVTMPLDGVWHLSTSRPGALTVSYRPEAPEGP